MKFEIDTDDFVAQTVGGCKYWIMKYKDFCRLENAVSRILSVLSDYRIQERIHERTQGRPWMSGAVSELNAAYERKKNPEPIQRLNSTNMTSEQKLLIDNFMRQTGLTAADIVNYLSDQNAARFFENSERVFETTVLDPRDLSS